MMGDRDYRSLIKGAINAISDEIEIKIDISDDNKIAIHEVTNCMRRAYFDRTDPIKNEHQSFGELSSKLLRKLHHGVENAEFEIDKIKLTADPDMIVDDAVILFRSSNEPIENPTASDMLYLNACLWIYNKSDGIIVYITNNKQESSFSLTKNKSMFEETIRRVRVLHDLLIEKKTPILEPSSECSKCQYYQKCYVKQRLGKTISISDIMGMKK